MAPQKETTGFGSQLSSDPLRRITKYQTAGVNARLRLFEALAAAGVPAGEADELVSALEASAIAGAQCEVAELDGRSHADRSEDYGQGWYDGVTTVADELVQIADRSFAQRDRATLSVELTVHLAELRQQERRELVRLQEYARGALELTAPFTMERRRLLEALGEADGLCTAWVLTPGTGHMLICGQEAGHYADVQPSSSEGDPGGWHRCNGFAWVNGAMRPSVRLDQAGR